MLFQFKRQRQSGGSHVWLIRGFVFFLFKVWGDTHIEMHIKFRDS